ncbi:MAG: protein-L-isoaspartate(D-aspartate) O-methyltransferase [Thermodesulfobacteriota bacterium]
MNAIRKHSAILFFTALLFLFLSFSAHGASIPGDTERLREQRHKMVKTQIAERGIEDEQVLQAMRDVLRHCFVPKGSRNFAYEDRPLAIGYGQTISQPYIVALMTELLKPNKEHAALEVGTGSGYQAAVLSRIVQSVYTIEIIPPLGTVARERLDDLGYKNVTVKIADGYFGWKEHAPFDSIIVTAASDHVPPPLVTQLKNGGRMVIPVGHPFKVQHLMLVMKSTEGEITMKNILPVRFVPFIREWK